jgi:hypothetical protein
MGRGRRRSGRCPLESGRLFRGRRDRQLDRQKTLVWTERWLTYRDKSKIEDGPNNVKSPMKASDAGRCDFDNYVVY